MIQLAVSPCSNPELTLEGALAAYRGLGFHRIELFTSWAQSAVDAAGDGARCKDLLAKYGFGVSSLHLPPLTEHLDVSLARAVKTCRLAADLECPVVLVKGKTRADIIAGAGRLLDAIGELALTPVLQNHAGTAISTLGDYREVLDGVRDPRLKCLLEVGHFHTVGVPWLEGYEALQGRIALVHLKDQIGGQSVPFGSGEIDLPGLLARLAADGYTGDIVIEMEVKDSANTLSYLADALACVREHLLDGHA